MTLHISREQARRFLALYHFTPTDIAGVMERLATVQYDPLNPVGRNPDLVFAARVPGYQVDDWQKAAYGERLMYDAWDKQASLITVKDGHTIFWRSAIDKRVNSTEQAPGIVVTNIIIWLIRNLADAGELQAGQLWRPHGT